MEVRIGVQQVSREIVIETAMAADEVAEAVAAAVAGSMLDLTDRKGRRVLVPSASLGYVEVGAESKTRVGFGT